MTTFSEVGDRSAGALDLAAMHAADRLVVELVAPVHGAVVAPDQDVAELPLVLVDVARLDGVLPQLVEQLLGFLDLEAHYVGAGAAAEEQRRLAAARIADHRRVRVARRGPD